MSFKIASYGAEHEWADHPLDRDPPKGFGRDVNDVTIVNSNGIANDPKGKTYRFGGEFNTPPTTTIEGQVQCMERLKEHYPEATINYRSNLHLHVRIPGLKDNLAMLKQLQSHIHRELPLVLAETVEPIPVPIPEEYPGTLELKGARRRFARRRVSHQCFLSAHRVAYQCQATTVKEFFEREPPLSKEEPRKPLWHLQPRVCVNLRQLLQTDTIEFRHFPGTMDPRELQAAFTWVKMYTEAALADAPIHTLKILARGWLFPLFLKYEHNVETRYRRTVHDGSLKQQDILLAVSDILRQPDGNLEKAREWMIMHGYSKGVL